MAEPQHVRRARPHAPGLAQARLVGGGVPGRGRRHCQGFGRRLARDDLHPMSIGVVQRDPLAAARQVDRFGVYARLRAEPAEVRKIGGAEGHAGEARFAELRYVQHGRGSKAAGDEPPLVRLDDDEPKVFQE